MTKIAWLPWLLLALVMTVDESRFHRRRELPRWERIGHPLDTLTVLVCLFWLILREPTPEHLAVFGALATFSSLFVTKDEFVHARHCEPAEHWVHSVLFLLHPVCLGSAAWLWWKREGDVFIPVLALALLFAGLYQTLYWNFLWKQKPPSTPPSTMSSESAGT